MSKELQIILGVAILILGSLWFSRRKKGEIVDPSDPKDFYWANQELTQNDAAHLHLTNSLSLNGLFYHAWLGYAVGIYSILIQAIWCASFLILSKYSKNLNELCRQDSFHGNLETYYSSRAKEFGILASCLSFLILIAWELSIASELLQSTLSIGDQAITVIVIFIALIAIVYTMRGGIRANLKANRFQNSLKAFSFIIIISFLIYLFFKDASNNLSFSEVLKFDIKYPLATIGIFGLISNGIFSFFWQVSDMSTWQNVSASSKSKNPRKGLLRGAAFIMIAPGLVGTILGMSISYYQDVNDSNIMYRIVETVSSSSPLIAILIFASLVAVMLSTLDGQFLASAQAVIWKKISKGLYEENNNDDIIDLEIKKSKMMSLTYIFIFVMGVLSVLIFILLKSGVISLFETAYFAVVGQMSLVPSSFGMIKNAGKITKLKNSASYSIISGLAAGGIMICMHIFKVTIPDRIDFIGSWVITAPVITILVSSLVYNFIKRKESKKLINNP